MKLSELPENYRKAENFQDFCIGDTVYYKTENYYREAKVQALIPSPEYSVVVQHSDRTYLFHYYSWDFYRIYVLNKEKEPKHNFKVNDRVLLVEKCEFNPRVKITGTILDIRNQYIAVKWDDIGAEDVISYSKDQWKHIKVINKAPKLTKEITLDLKVHFNLDTTGLETVLVDCVKALVSNGKYQEAKELCELLVSVQSLGKAQNATQDDSAEGT